MSDRDGPGRIESPTNPRIRAVVRLRDRRERDATGLTIVDGAREIARAVAAGARFVEAYVCPPLLRSADARAAEAALHSTGVPRIEVPEVVLAKLAFGDRAEGLVAVVRFPGTALADLRLPADPLVVVVEGLEKPGNLGAILRSVDGAGADALITADARTDLFNPNAIRASLGTIFRVPLAAGTTTEVLAWLRGSGLRIVVARVDAERLHTETDLTGPLALVLGSEAEGLAAGWSGPDLEAVRLPMHGLADSLNVSVAAAVLLYEARRQRGRPPRRFP
jgi:TrmH family RNA methyltransferase